MSFILTKNAGVPVKYTIEGYLETAAELATFRTDFTLGSKVITIDEGKEYVLTEEGWTYLHDVTVEEINKLKAEMQSLSKLKNWLGETTTPITQGSTVNPIMISGQEVTARPGDVAKYQDDQFIFSDAGTWQPYDDTLDVYTKDEVDALLDGKMDKTGGQFTGDVTTTNTTFGNTSFITKGWVDENAKAITDVTVLPTGSAIKNTIYRLATTAGNVTTYTYYLGDAANQTTTQITDKQYIDDLAGTKLDKTGGQVTGDVTTTNTTFGDTSFITKQWVNENAKAITDVTSLPTGSAIKDTVYRLATTVDNVTTYTYYLGDHTNQTTTQITDKDYIDTLAATKLNLSGGALTGDVTTSNTTFGNTSLVPKSYVDSATMPVWQGTRAQYNALQEPLPEGTIVFITDEAESYEDLSNRPSINSVVLSGNKTGADLGLVDAVSGKGLSTNDYDNTEKAKVAAAYSTLTYDATTEALTLA